LLAHHPSLSVAVPATPPDDAPDAKKLDERRHTDGVSVNFNAQFADDAGEAVTFVSERTGAASLFLSRAGFIVSAHEKPESGPFWSWVAVYAARATCRRRGPRRHRVVREPTLGVRLPVLETAARGGWPTWHGEHTLSFRRVADDGWWSVFWVDLSPETLEPTRDGERA
jgi:hypothetical protein